MTFVYKPRAVLALLFMFFLTARSTSSCSARDLLTAHANAVLALQAVYFVHDLFVSSLKPPLGKTLCHAMFKSYKSVNTLFIFFLSIFSLKCSIFKRFIQIKY